MARTLERLDNDWNAPGWMKKQVNVAVGRQTAMDSRAERVRLKLEGERVKASGYCIVSVRDTRLADGFDLLSDEYENGYWR